MSNFLDIDPKIMENNFLVQSNLPSNTENFENFLRSIDHSYSVESAPWKYATPTPGYCIKTNDDKKNKVFINLCQLNEIPEPRQLDEAELLELWHSVDASDYRVPLSIQDPHEELDKSGKQTVAYDVAVNNQFFRKIQSSTILRSFVLQVVFEGVENKYNVSLNKEGYVILQNRKCLGVLKPHRIRIHKGPYVPPKPLIQELSNFEDTSCSYEDKLPGIEKNECSGQKYFRLIENTRTRILIGEFYLPKVIKVNDLILDAGEDRLIVESQRGYYSMDFFLPIRINQARVTAYFYKKTKVLSVIMPIIVERH